jgi:hypothetical protein
MIPLVFFVSVNVLDVIEDKHRIQGYLLREDHIKERFAPIQQKCSNEP